MRKLKLKLNITENLNFAVSPTEPEISCNVCECVAVAAVFRSACDNYPCLASCNHNSQPFVFKMHHVRIMSLIQVVPKNLYTF